VNKHGYGTPPKQDRSLGLGLQSMGKHGAGRSLFGTSTRPRTPTPQSPSPSEPSTPASPWYKHEVPEEQRGTASTPLWGKLREETVTPKWPVLVGGDPARRHHSRHKTSAALRNCKLGESGRIDKEVTANTCPFCGMEFMAWQLRHHARVCSLRKMMERGLEEAEPEPQKEDWGWLWMFMKLQAWKKWRRWYFFWLEQLRLRRCAIAYWIKHEKYVKFIKWRLWAAMMRRLLECMARAIRHYNRRYLLEALRTWRAWWWDVVERIRKLKLAIAYWRRVVQLAAYKAWVIEAERIRYYKRLLV